MPIKIKEIKMTYKHKLPEGMSGKEVQEKIDQAFSILFTAVEKDRDNKGLDE